VTLVKICGITNIEDAVECVRLGANMLGFIFADSPRRVDVDTVKHIDRIIGGDARTVGVFTDETEEIISIAHDCDLTHVQLHGGQSEEFARRLGASRVIRVARVENEASVDALAQYETAAFYLLDTYKKGVAGGTGETFDWELAVRAKSLGKPLILSGGLNPDNVSEAVQMVQPYAVDVSTGVETSPGKKDLAKVKEFIENVRKADNRA
jgi:phosphoribosylanthranilate isomerase